MPNAATFMGMPAWLSCVLMAVASWGAYVVTIHAGQKEMGMAAVKGFFIVGVAYFLVAVLGPGTAIFGFSVEEAKPWTMKGVLLCLLAGTLGAMGALGIILAMKFGGTPVTVTPLVFGFAPIVGVILGIILHPPANPIDLRFYLGCLMSAGGAGLVLAYKPT